MNDMQSALIDALKERETEQGAKITCAGAEYPCSGGAVIGGKSLQAGGLRVNAQASIVVRLELFAGTASPQEKQTLSYKASADGTARTLRIDAVNNLLDAALQLECNDPNQGA